MLNNKKYDIILNENCNFLKERLENMKVNYNGIWKLLIDKNMNRKDLAEKAGISSGTISKMGHGEFVSMNVLYKIGKTLDADYGEMVSMKTLKVDDDH